LKFWKAVELAVFWSGVKECRLQNQETEGKLIWSNAAATSECFALLPAFWKLDY